MAIYNRALTTNDVARNYNEGSSSPEVGFTTTSSTGIESQTNVTLTVTLSPSSIDTVTVNYEARNALTLLDGTTNDHDGTVNGATWVSGINGRALEFDGDDHVQIPHSSQLNIASGDDFSFSAWVYVPELNGFWQGLVTKSRDDDLNRWWGMWIDSSDQWHTSVGANGIDGSAVTIGWHHIAFVQNSPNVTMYIDGSSDGTTTSDDALGTGDVWFAGTAEVSEYFKGILDDVRMYNRALSANEMVNLSSAKI